MTRHMRDDEGASLILVIIYVLIFAVVIGAVLDFASTGLRTSENVVGIRSQQHALDGAMDGAINAVRQNMNAGIGDETCDYTYDGADGQKINVVCEADTTIDPGGPDDRQPEYAILTGRWRTPTNDCAGFQQTGNNAMTVNGGIYSNGPIAIGDYENNACPNEGASAQRVMNVWFQNAWARGRCTPEATIDKRIVMFTPGTTRECNRSETAKAIPLYDPEKSTIAAVATPNGYDPLPTCVSPTRVVRFTPGVYTEAPRWHAERAGCTGDIWWFQPGTYYFNFPSNRAEWAVNPNNIIGGSLKDKWLTGSTPNLTKLAAEWNDLDDTDGDVTNNHDVCEDAPYQTSKPGVQFIFGGDSRLTTRSENNGRSGVINLCAGQSSIANFNQRIVLYGLQQAAVQPTQDNRQGAVPNKEFVADAAPTSTSGFVNPGNAWKTDNDFASKLFTRGDSSATVDFASFAHLPDPANLLPDGAHVTSVKVEIHHKEDGDYPGELAKSATIHWDSDGGTGGPGKTFVMGSNNSNLCSQSNGSFGDTIDTCDLTDVLQVLPNTTRKNRFLWREIKSLSASYNVDPSGLGTHKPCNGNPTACPNNIPNTATAHLNSIVLKVSYRPPGFEALDSSDPFLVTTNNPFALFEGTFFTPFADLDVNVHNGGTTEFARGVIANHIRGAANSSSKQTTAPFSLPGRGEESRVTLFKAYVGDKDNGGKLGLIARVAFDDLDGIAGRNAHIYDWTYKR